jgi:hypothetical protein
MKIAAIDMSATISGIAIFDTEQLGASRLIEATEFGRKKALILGKDYMAEKHPYDFLEYVDAYVEELFCYLKDYEFDMVLLEQTNNGRNRWTQKLLEWVHYIMCSKLTQSKIPVKYLDTSEWRNLLGAKLSKSDKKINRFKTRHKERGKITSKHVAIQYAQDKYGLELKLRDNNIADAICLGSAYLMILDMGDEAYKDRVTKLKAEAKIRKEKRLERRRIKNEKGHNI